jgi:cell division protein FtsA
VVEIVEQVLQKSKPMDTKTPQEINCIVLTGGGAQLKHIKQLVEYITGMDTRIGYPNEHLAGDSDEEISSPLYATAVGYDEWYRQSKHSAIKIDEIVSQKQLYIAPCCRGSGQKAEKRKWKQRVKHNAESTGDKIKKTFLIAMLTRLKIFR